MLRIKQKRLLCFGVIILGVLLLGMPAAYAQDEPNAPEWVGSAPEAVNSNAAVEEGLETLGDIDKDLVYTPVTPCAIVDTRYGGGGFIYSFQTRDYYVWGSNVAGQGGASNCPSPRGEPRAVHINMVAIKPNGKGVLQALPKNESLGIGGLSVNFNNIGTNLVNAGTIKTYYGSGPEITVTSQWAGCDVRIKVLGYYYDAEPEKITAVDAYSNSTSVNIGTSYTTIASRYVDIPISGYVVLSGSTSLSHYGINYMYCRFTENGSQIANWYFGDADVRYQHMSRTEMKSVSPGGKTYALQCYRNGGTSNSVAAHRSLVVQFIREPIP